jgi:4-hydroxyphenylpyruvate dioxygenase
MLLHLNHSCFPGLSVVQFLDVAEAAGADGVDLNLLGHAEPSAAIAAAVRARGVRIGAIHALTDWALPDDPDPRPALESLLDAASAIGAGLIICVAPLRMDPLPAADIVRASAVERLSALAALARPRGIRLALEQVGQSSSRPGAHSGIRRLREAWEIAAAAADDTLLVVDSYNLATAGEPFAAMLTTPAARLGIAHLADAGIGAGIRVPPGEGSLDLSAFVRALWQTGYRGPLSLEIFPHAPWPSPLAFARRALAAMRAYVPCSPS